MVSRNRVLEFRLSELDQLGLENPSRNMAFNRSMGGFQRRPGGGDSRSYEQRGYEQDDAGSAVDRARSKRDEEMARQMRQGSSTGRDGSREEQRVRGWDFALLPLVATRVVDHGRTTMRSTRKAGRDKAGGAGGGALPVHGAPLLGEEGDRGGRLQNGEGAPPGGGREEGRTVEGHPTARGEVAGPHHRGARVPVLARAVEPGAGAECGRVSDSHGWLCIVLRRGGTAGAAGNMKGSLLAPATGYGGCRGAWCHTCAATKEAGVPGLVRCVTFHSRACCFPGVGYWHPWEAVRGPLALPTP